MSLRFPQITLVAVMVGMLSPGVGAQVSGRIDRVGLFAGADPAVRNGNWSFVEVSLKFRGAAPFDGQLQLHQPDRDGDLVTSILPVALAPNEDWRPYQIYFVPHEGSGGNVHVSLHNAQGALEELFSDAGEPIKELSGPQTSEISPDELLILDLTNPKRLPHVAELDADAAGERDKINARRVRGLLPRELPSSWQGLEAVDAIVWDDADPSTLSQQQIEAILGWVKAGGRLLLTAGKNWQALAQSPLAAALPVTLRGVTQTTEAQEFLDLVENDAYESKLSRYYAKHPITRCRMSPLPDALPMPTDCPNAPICYRRMPGRGVLIFVGASLRQLLPAPKTSGADEESGDPSEAKKKRADDPFIDIACEKIVGRRLLALPAVRNDRGNMLSPMSPDLFQFLRSSIAFESVGTRFLILAILFAIAYTFLATTGSYWYLKRRSLEHHCWTAFGAASIAASILGTGMVGLLRGVQKKLWQTTIVDAQSGVDYGYASCLFGIKTPNHTRLDLRLPVGDPESAMEQAGPLRAMPASTSFETPDSKFTAAAGYESELGGTALRRVPIRATLKELQGSWNGLLGGMLDARLVMKKTTDKDAFRYEFGEGSYIRNNLGITLRECYLLETSEEVAGERPTPFTHCFFIGDIPTSGPESQLDAPMLRQRLYFVKDKNAKPDAPLVHLKELPMLDKVLDNIAGPLRPLTATSDFQSASLKLTGDQVYPAMLLLSLYDLLPRDDQNGIPFKRSHGRNLSCTNRLGKQTALLIGHSDEPPAATLEVGGKPMKPNKSNTIYRFVIPVKNER